MSNQYQAYAEYKDSVVEWIEKIPEHWGTSKLRYMFSFDKGLTITKENLLDEGVPCVNYGEVHSKYGFEVDPVLHPLKCVSEMYLKSSKSSLLSQGDLVFADTSEDIDGSGNFTQLISDQPVFAGYHTIIARPKDRQSSRFYAYLFDSQEFRTQIKYAVKGVKVFSITQAILKSVDIWLPKLDERKKIANFLDHETAKIDTLIEKQQLLIKLLKEKRQAVISHAVTKGLNPNAPLRDSGVEWLGEVPEHWEVCKLKHIIVSLESGVSVNAADIPARGDELGVLKTSCVYTRSFRVEENKTVVKEEYNRVKCPVRKGAIIISRMNTPELVGASALVETGYPQIFLPDRLWQTVFSNANTQNPKFISFFMMVKGFRNQISLAAEGASSSMQNIAKDDYLSINIAFPIIEEQNAIVSYLEKILSDLKNLEHCANEAIELIQERRTALISAAVTGKIDVRNWQAPNSENKVISA